MMQWERRMIKSLRTIDLPYPGGPQIDKLAQYGKDTYDFPRVWLEKESYDFSFSGLKSSVINKLHNLRQKNEKRSCKRRCSKLVFKIVL